MTATTPACQIFVFPDTRRWSCIARKYVDYSLMGDPRAAYFYLEHELALLKVRRLPFGLKRAIYKEYRKRGLPGRILFC